MLHDVCITSDIYVTYLPSMDILFFCTWCSIVFCYHKSWVVFSLRYECYFVSESLAVAENWKYLGNASYIIRKKYHKKSRPWWCWKCYIESPYFRTNRGNKSDTRAIRSERRLHYSSVIGFLAADVIVAVISVLSYSPRICIWLKICRPIYLFYIGMCLRIFIY